MRITRWMLSAATAFAAALPGHLYAQGVTTGSISGTVTNEQAQGVDAVQVQVRNTSTGATAGTLTHNDGRYTVTVRRIGFAPQTKGSMRVALGGNSRVDFQLTQQVTQLAGVTVSAT